MRFCLIVGILLSFISSIDADVERWSPLGPIYGGVVRAMVSNDQYVYAGTRGDGIFRREIAGGNWEQVGLRNVTINALAIHPHVPDTIFAGLQSSGLHVSRDAGETWETTNQFVKDSILDIQWHPKFPNLICLVGQYSGIALSHDRGGSWELRNRGIESVKVVRAVAFHSDAENIIFAATTGEGVFKTDNGGEFWTPINAGISSVDVRCLAHQALTDTWYAGTYEHGVFHSRDLGENWETINSGIPIKYPYAYIQVIEVDPRDPDLVYVGSREGFFISRDRGNTWESQPELLEYDVRSIEPMPTSLLVGTWAKGVFRKTESESWHLWNEGLTNINISNFAINPVDARIMVATTWGAGLYRTTDGGRSWHLSDSGITNKMTIDLAIPPGHPNRIYAASDGAGIFLSRDSGNTWRAINQGLKAGIITSILINPTNQNQIYAGTEYIGLYRSDDAGARWEETGLNRYAIWEIAVNPQNPAIIYVGTWGIKAYAYEGLGVLRSLDGADTWEMVLELDNAALAVEVDPARPERIYVGTHGSGIFRSLDGGETWEQANQGIGEVKVWALAIAPWNSEHIFAATEGNGVYYTENSGEQWIEMNDGLENLNFYAIHFTPGYTNQLIIAGTSGFYTYTLSLQRPETAEPPDVEPPAVVVTETEVLTNFPNPFNSETWIPYRLVENAEVEISIYSANGGHIRTLQIGTQTRGEYITRNTAAHWSGRNEAGEPVADGTYFYQFRAGDYRVTKKMVILK